MYFFRFLASGETYRSLSFAFRVGRQTIAKIVPETCHALWTHLKSDCMQFPSTPNEWKGIAENFLKAWQLLHCCGSIDEKHVLMVCPKNSGSLNFNYKGTFSNVLLAVADANHKFLYIDYGHYGSESDGGIFRKVQFGQMMETCRLNLPNDDYLPNSEIMFPFYFIGDEAFPLKRNLMRPYPRCSAIS
ncbi:uncharacterized protein LOC111642179 [Centruroides sculpturatus]|uniref:uncharacterized protein LOC111642179 n=1 Tax=Centruroides sculpturatus TaxID=218467 RepID=UPI000C6DD71D|nr:uncharacterized protein LOC111642179 [Centruroides sculpturatus]